MKRSRYLKRIERLEQVAKEREEWDAFIDSVVPRDPVQHALDFIRDVRALLGEPPWEVDSSRVIEREQLDPEVVRCYQELQKQKDRLIRDDPQMRAKLGDFARRYDMYMNLGWAG
jgi:hypothetical protein